MRSSEKFHRRMQPVMNTALTITTEIKNKCVKYITNIRAKQISLLAVDNIQEFCPLFDI